MVAAEYVIEDYAVAYLADDSAQSDAVLLRDGAIRAQADPDALPLVVALLERAAYLAVNPSPRRPHSPRPEPATGVAKPGSPVRLRRRPQGDRVGEWRPRRTRGSPPVRGPLRGR